MLERILIVVVPLVALVASMAACTSDAGPGSTDDPWTFPDDDAGTRCLSSEHVCDGECVDQLDNLPDNGCARGCGERCVPPPGGTAICTPDGACDFECAEGVERRAGRCECVPETCAALGAQCGTLDDGCGMELDCGACKDGGACNANRCGCEADAAEPNDVPGAAHALGELTDRPASDETFSFGLATATDIDWYKAVIADRFGDGNPSMTVTLGDIPEGATYEIGLRYICDGSGDGGACEGGTVADVGEGEGCVIASTSASAQLGWQAGCDGTNESGTLLIRIRATGDVTSCEPYSLRVQVD
jgi:hypothetical protein